MCFFSFYIFYIISCARPFPSEGGKWVSESGTSASAPVLAGMISLVNSARRRAGKGNLGWVNPALYALAGGFSNDIVSGNNKCCAGHNISTIVCCDQGFESVIGWDPVVGFGTIDFPKFLSTMVAFNGLPIPSPSNSSSAGLSGGAIAGIVIGVLVTVALVVIALILLQRRKSTMDAPLISENRENSKFGA